MSDWGICATVKAPIDQVRAFVAHHLAIGAGAIWLYFDDPDDPAASAIATIAKVQVIRCDAAYWQAQKVARPDQHQLRQSRNIRHCYRAIDLPWLCHIDVDEFVWPRRPVNDVLAAVPADATMVRMVPWEALYSPHLPADVFAARYFRSSMRGRDRAADREAAFGKFAFLLPSGMLSHTTGKCYYRTGLQNFRVGLHRATGKGVGPTATYQQTDLALLHFHAHDRAQWLDRLQFRLRHGAYRENLGLTSYLQICGKAGQIAFYDQVQTASDTMLDHLGRIGVLTEADLQLQAKVELLEARPKSGARKS
jgi:Glycosyl transferase family 2